MKKVYPVKLTPAENGYVVTIPDLNINTEGSDIANAIEMARDAIGLWSIAEQDAGRSIPAPKSFKIQCDEDEISALVDIDLEAYRKSYYNRTVRKNVTIPYWLNELAEKNKANFSALLQEAIKAHYC